VNPALVNTSRNPHARLRPVAASAVTLEDAFWQPRREMNRAITLPSQFAHLETSGTRPNFRRAAKKEADTPFRGPVFMDSDLYKWLEAGASALATDDDPALRALVNTAIGEIEAAQQPDGYLNTHFTFDKANLRYSNLRDWHELYCAGHLFQAAVAHFRATGDERLLNVARRFADHLCETFGDEEGKKRQTDGHEEIEMALVELFRATGERRYLDLARFFLDVRGQKTVGGGAYHQDHVAFRDLAEVTGHAVRMTYLACGAADVYLETGDATLKTALERQWRNLTTRRMYVSGGLGARYEGEAFGDDYELPNARAYTETCAAIGSVMWNHRMLLATGAARYADLLEHTLYNAVLPGLSLDGQAYFYQNPLEDDGKHRRQPWFGCACCPPNVARLLAQLPAYFYSTTDDGDDGSVFIHLYAASRAQITRPGGGTLTLRQRTNYPWDGDIALTIEEVTGGSDFALLLRVPGWCESGAVLEVNGEPHPGPLPPGDYVELRRTWKAGDTIHLRLPLPVCRVACHPYVAENAARVALLRGPILYCVEQADHPDFELRDLVLTFDAELTPRPRPDLLGGIVTLEGTAALCPPGDGWTPNTLYQTISGGASATGVERKTVSLTAVPYFAWANREPGRMHVWLRER